MLSEQQIHIGLFFLLLFSSPTLSTPQLVHLFEMDRLKSCYSRAREWVRVKILRKREPISLQDLFECPCFADIRDGPCGKAFLEAYACYQNSKEKVRGSDCLEYFVVLHKCVDANPDAFASIGVDAKAWKDAKKRAADTKTQ
uniref:Mia40 n=1 Tax=Stygiella incarcerata TaxID=1712417 RepID=A0A192ZIN7_9EUKA|nr:Mia40 [Stygiella incarcerata]